LVPKFVDTACELAVGKHLTGAVPGPDAAALILHELIEQGLAIALLRWRRCGHQ
jgi:hypothetical protein